MMEVLFFLYLRIYMSMYMSKYTSKFWLHLQVTDRSGTFTAWLELIEFNAIQWITCLRKADYGPESNAILLLFRGQVSVLYALLLLYITIINFKYFLSHYHYYYCCCWNKTWLKPTARFAKMCPFYDDPNFPFAHQKIASIFRETVFTKEIIIFWSSQLSFN